MNEPLVVKATLRTVPPPVSQPVATVRQHWWGNRRRGLAILVVLIVALAAALGMTWWSMQSAATVHYVTVAATRGTVARTVTATGTVNPELTIIVGSYVSGVITELHCDYNTRVTAGQVCAKIDPRPYQTLVDQSKANLSSAKAQLEKDKANVVYTKINEARRQWLAEHDSEAKDVADLAKSLYDQALAQVDLDQAAIEQHQAALDSALVNLGYTNIVSPVDGTVVSRNVTQGQTVASSFQTPTLFLIASDLTKMQVDTNVSESDIGGIKEGDKASFTVDAYPARVFEGTVTQLRQSPQTVQNVVTYDAVISVANPDLALKPGLTASTRIIVDRRDDVVRVPNQALRYAPGGVAESAAPGATASGAKESHLWVLRDGRPVQLTVVVGLDDENFTELVKADLRPDDQVIVSGARSASGSQSALPLPRL